MEYIEKIIFTFGENLSYNYTNTINNLVNIVINTTYNLILITKTKKK